MHARPASPVDASAIADIYNQGIEDRVATFETRPRSPEEVAVWFGMPYPIVVVEDEAGAVIAFANLSAYRPRACYDGVGEFSVYVARHARSRGAGRLAMEALIAAAERGYWKLVSRVFPENTASLKLLASLGFRQVGVYEKHARLDGLWRDVVIMELLLPM